MHSVSQDPVPVHRHVSSYKRLGWSAGTGIACSILAGLSISWVYAPLAFWDATALVLLIGLWRSLYSLGPTETRAHATSEDPGRGSAELILVCASIASLAAVFILIAQSHGFSESAKVVHVALGVASIIISWAVVHSLYALRYADMFFKHQAGIDFNDNTVPTYRDFVYLSFTVGMTYQVADTNLRTTKFRTTVLGHAMLSYLFGTAIIATTINLVVNLGS